MPTRLALLLLVEDVGHRTPQTLHDLLEPLKRHALLAILQAVEGRGRDAELPGKLGVGPLSPLLTQERAQLLVQAAAHPKILPKVSFRMRNICLHLAGQGTK